MATRHRQQCKQRFAWRSNPIASCGVRGRPHVLPMGVSTAKMSRQVMEISSVPSNVSAYQPLRLLAKYVARPNTHAALMAARERASACHAPGALARLSLPGQASRHGQGPSPQGTSMCTGAALYHLACELWRKRCFAIHGVPRPVLALLLATGNPQVACATCRKAATCIRTALRAQCVQDGNMLMQPLGFVLERSPPGVLLASWKDSRTAAPRAQHGGAPQRTDVDADVRDHAHLGGQRRAARRQVLPEQPGEGAAEGPLSQRVEQQLAAAEGVPAQARGVAAGYKLRWHRRRATVCSMPDQGHAPRSSMYAGCIESISVSQAHRCQRDGGPLLTHQHIQHFIRYLPQQVREGTSKAFSSKG